MITNPVTEWTERWLLNVKEVNVPTPIMNKAQMVWYIWFRDSVAGDIVIEWKVRYGTAMKRTRVIPKA